MKTITLGAAAVQFGCLSDSLERLAFSYVDENDEETKAAKIARTFPDSFRLTLISKYARKTDSYTQGLLFEFDQTVNKGVLYESGGKYGASLLRKTDAETGKVLKQIKVPKQYFAEGLASVGDKLYLLTWRERTCFVYDKESFEQINEFRYSGEGWGLAYDGKNLLMSDGSSKIRFLDPKSFRQIKSIDVHYVTSSGKRRPVYNLNELEIVDGEIWANVYQQEYVVRINSDDGLVLGNALNFSALTPSSLKTSSEYVLNGLAFDSTNRRLFVTGKCWPIMYVFSVEPQNK
ncbi:MAG: glutaminyl-peptide cyclotransferase [Thermoguttaceae bacterium]|nr:glutaminyl-peptide cyclotransferase [Thermoguttaceae bacterium]